MWELDHKESWVPKNWCFWTVVLEKILESPVGCKEIKPVNPKGNQPWIFIERTDAEAPILWPWVRRADSEKKTWCWERLRAKEEEGNRGWDVWMTSQTQSLWVWANSGNFVKDREAWCAAVHEGHKKLDTTATEQEQENQNIPKTRNRSRWMETSLGNKGQASSSAGNRGLNVEGKPQTWSEFSGF